MTVVKPATLEYPLEPQSKESHWHYQVYGQRLCSNLPLPELPRCNFEVRDVVFRQLPPDASAVLNREDTRLLLRRSTNLGCDLSLYSAEQGFLLRWEGQCDFLVSGDGCQIHFQPLPETNPVWVYGTLYGMILSFALHLRSINNFHGSAVVLPEGAVGFLADPGSGKSTLAAGFALAGYPLLTDDVLAVREDSTEYVACSGFPYVSLSSQSLDSLFGPTGGPPRISEDEEKQRVAIELEGMPFSRTPRPLRALFLPMRDTGERMVRINPLPRALAIRSLLEHTNCLPLLPPDVLQPHMAFVARLTAAVPVYRLHYPSDLQRIPQVIAAVLGHQRQAGPWLSHGLKPSATGRG